VLRAAYRPLIRGVVRWPWAVVGVSGLILAATVLPWQRLGSEFMPPLQEGSILYMPTTVPGISIAQSREILQYQDSVLSTFPEVEMVLGKAGRAETATDPAPMDMFETTITLKPARDWRPGMTWERLISELDAAVSLPGVTNAWTMPIKGRIDMLATGVRTPVGVKIFGPDLDTLQALGQDVERAMRDFPGTRSAFAERGVSGFYVDIAIDRPEAARYGLNVGDIHGAIMATVGGVNAATTVEGRERYSVNVRYPRELRDELQKIREVIVPAPSGAQIPLGQVATVEVVQGPMAVKTENAFPVTTVFIDIETSDIGGFVEEAQRHVAASMALPAGYTMVWSGQFEFMQRVRERLSTIVPLTLLIVFTLLYMNFGRVTPSALVMVALPFGLVGGVWFLWLLGYNTSVAVWVGFIALAGVAAETGVVMLIYLEEAYERYRAEGRIEERGDVADAVVEGALERLRPVAMTVLTVIAGLMPILWSGGTGADVMKRIAAPMVGGMVSATALTLLVIPALYLIWRRRETADA
jgi:Cu(I)/Ag(I) efflux system membrane protein CusA/SilA